jgi:3-methyl-2-oxobutanoate hydroxymethyltransferase
MSATVTIPVLQQMKRDGTKIVGVVAWDYQIATIADRAGVDIVSVGDSVGVNLWGHANPLEVTMEQMVIVCQAVRRGVSRALVSCDFPFGPLQEGVDSAVRAAIRLVKEAGADVVKLDGASDYPEAVDRHRAGRDPGVRPVRYHATERAAVRAELRADGDLGRAGT